MITKVCGNCSCWWYKDSVGGISYGVCENEDSDFYNTTLSEDEYCLVFEEDDYYEI